MTMGHSKTLWRFDRWGVSAQLTRLWAGDYSPGGEMSSSSCYELYVASRWGAIVAQKWRKG